jgi:uncharacterized cupredoxin-like copper-binding protein
MIRLAALFILIGPVVVAWIWSAAAVAGPEAETVTVRLSSFAFTPSLLHLRSGVPVRLHLVNDSAGGHNVSAPALFLLASAFPNGAPPAGGKVELGPGQSQDLLLVPRAPGTYKLECTHFLHNLFGMTGTIVVE